MTLAGGRSPELRRRLREQAMSRPAELSSASAASGVIAAQLDRLWLEPRGYKRCPHCKQMLSPGGTPQPNRRALPPGTKFINGIPVGILVSDSVDVPLAPHERVSSETPAGVPDDSDFLDSADVELVDDDELI